MPNRNTFKLPVFRGSFVILLITPRTRTRARNARFKQAIGTQYSNKRSIETTD